MSQSKPLILGARATEKIREFMNQQGKDSLIVRVTLVRTHCMGGRGYAYQLKFERDAADDDQLFENDGIRLAVENSSASRLQGTEIDYVESLERQGFVIGNPNAVAKCPCGHHDIFELTPSKQMD